MSWWRRGTQQPLAGSGSGTGSAGIDPEIRERAPRWPSPSTETDGGTVEIGSVQDPDPTITLRDSLLLSAAGGPPGFDNLDGLTADEPLLAQPVDIARLRESLRRLGIRTLTSDDGDLVALWSDHSVLLSLEGSEQTVLALRAQADRNVPGEWETRALTGVNEFNTRHRYLRALLGARTDDGMPLYADAHFHVGQGLHDAALDDLLDTVLTATCVWSDWMRDEGGLL